jgi:hypothetical protein
MTAPLPVTKRSPACLTASPAEPGCARTGLGVCLADHGTGIPKGGLGISRGRAAGYPTPGTHGGGSVRHGAGVEHSASGRPDDRGWPAEPEDGAGAVAGLRPDVGTEMSHLDGRVRLQWRDVQRLRDRAGRRSHRPGRHYLPGCPLRPEMLLDSILKLHDKIQNMKLGVNRQRQITKLEQARLRHDPLRPMGG